MHAPWYKQFWPWFLIALPLSAVIGSFTTLYVFTQHSVSLVAQDYYTKGKAINLDLSKVHIANSFSLQAQIVSDSDQVILTLDKGQLANYPALLVTFTHRTLADRDFIRSVTPDASGRYRMRSPAPIEGPWFVEVEPITKEWLLQGKVNFPSTAPTRLVN